MILDGLVKMSNRNLNGSIAGGALVSCSADEEVAACDELPPALRALIKGSFVNTRATTVLEQWRDLEAQGVPLEAYADWYAQRLAYNQAASCSVTYGATHPNAQLSTRRSASPRPGEPPPPSQPQNPRDITAGSGVDSERARAARRAAQISLDDV